ncbi:Enhancer of polycomb-like protein [Sparassis crispa]|uniref:Enhancer of polycomb-like protein n=1 Tax=Sparassis crispa TaxID=139825 RepID=A0A401H3Q8_9APHY|nr:Enhancer of polycomb-like protein [Sparassis crispa]GBE89019.1 Enhancer of polycomb-like protein [Sparassis crispa]
MSASESKRRFGPALKLIAPGDDAASRKVYRPSYRLYFSAIFPPLPHDMPRNHNAGPSTLRNRNRVTNKTRLKVITESIDADPIVLDEDEEKARVVSTAGVDAEDANEHHLQAVLFAAATRHQAGSRSTRAASEKEKAAPAIPTPDSTGLVDNYEELYHSDRWKDPHSYVKSSDTVEEACSFALTNGFIYYMDERDKEWLDKNNEEARGEGTSAQGALSAAGTRSGRSAKAKGKEPEVAQPVVMTEDEFELVMALFEKVTHEKTEFLHHGLEQGGPFPPFSDYQETFGSPLTPVMFALFAVPDWIPPPAQLFRFARVVYPYWRERRSERRGHRIIPTVNLDETDTLNESYICFRRREIKAIRKTRAQQTTYSDKMTRLQGELNTSVELAKNVLRREHLKRETAIQGHSVWDKRLSLVDLKRKYSSLGGKEDEELLHDRERVPKKPKIDTPRLPFKLRTRDNGDSASPVVAEPAIKPKERQAAIRSQIEQGLAKIKEKDRQWEDLVDNPYQPAPVSLASRMYKIISATRALSLSTPTTDSSERPSTTSARAGRLRFGRGGRIYLDRRIVRARSEHHRESCEGSEDDDDTDAQSPARKVRGRWKFDADDDPAVGPEGPDEQDRMLVDDFQPKYLVHRMTLLNEQDHQAMSVDAGIAVTGADGRQQVVTPFKPQPAMPRREIQPMAQRPVPSSSVIPGQQISSIHHANGVHVPMPGTNGMPVAMAAQLKKMAPPVGVPHMRISSNGGIRLPAASPVPNMHSTVPTPLASPYATPPGSAGQVNGFHEASGQASDGTEQDVKLAMQTVPNGNGHLGSDHPVADPSTATGASTSPLRAKAQVQQPVAMPTVPNGYHIPPINAYPTMSKSQYMHATGRPNGLTMQQMHNIKSVYASMSPSPDTSMQSNNNANMAIRAPSTYMGHVLPNGANYQVQFTAAQWATAAAQQRSPPMNGVVVDGNVSDAAAIAAFMSPPPQGMPARVPSANGMSPAPLARGVGLSAGQGRVSPASAQFARLSAPHSPSPLLTSPSLSAAQAQSSPVRPPSMPTPSPSLQSRQVVGGPGAGY